MDWPVICSSMRKRADWSALFPALVQSKNPTGRWKEAKLETHDVAMPLSLAGQPPNLAFRAICLSPRDVGTPEANKRIERLYNLNGGQYVAIVFLAKSYNDESGPALMMRLQLELLNGFEMPVIPLPSVDELSKTVKAFHDQLQTGTAPDSGPSPARDLLPYCSHFRKLPEHTVNVVSDITTDFKGLVAMATTQEGQQRLADYVGAEAEQLITFWQSEYSS